MVVNTELQVVKYSLLYYAILVASVLLLRTVHVGKTGRASVLSSAAPCLAKLLDNTMLNMSICHNLCLYLSLSLSPSLPK